MLGNNENNCSVLAISITSTYCWIGDSPTWVMVIFLYYVKAYTVLLTIHSLDSWSICVFPEQYKTPLLQILTRKHNPKLSAVHDTFWITNPSQIMKKTLTPHQYKVYICEWAHTHTYTHVSTWLKGGHRHCPFLSIPLLYILTFDFGSDKAIRKSPTYTPGYYGRLHRQVILSHSGFYWNYGWSLNSISPEN